MKFSIIIAARTGSSRLPGKVLLPLKGIPIISFLIRRIRNSKMADKIILATTTLSEDDNLASVAAAENIPVFRGDNNDVVKRFVDAASEYNMEYVVRITGDCPFTDAETLDYCLSQCKQFGSFDLATTKPAFPNGIDYEIYKAKVMKLLHKENKLNSADREHLTLYLYNHQDKYKIKQVYPLPKWKYRERHFMIDTPEDYAFSQRLVKNFNTIYFSAEDIIKFARL